MVVLVLEVESESVFVHSFQIRRELVLPMTVWCCALMRQRKKKRKNYLYDLLLLLMMLMKTDEKLWNGLDLQLSSLWNLLHLKCYL